MKTEKWMTYQRFTYFSFRRFRISYWL